MVKRFIIRQLMMRAITPNTLAVSKPRALALLARCEKAELTYAIVGRPGANSHRLIATMRTGGERH